MSKKIVQSSLSTTETSSEVFCRKGVLKNSAGNLHNFLEHLFYRAPPMGFLYYSMNSVQSFNSFMTRGGPKAAATSKMECFVIIVNGWKPLTIITKRSILDVAAALDPPLMTEIFIT